MKAYAYKKPWKRFLARAVDAAGYFFHRPEREREISPKRILVVRLDQLGDIVQTLPFFDSLRHSFPNAAIHFLTTPTGAELFSDQGRIDEVHVWNCPWFDANRRSEKSAGEIAKEIRAQEFDCAFELRGDLRLIALLKWAGVKNLIGFGATGGGFLLDVEAEWNPSLPAVDKNLALLEAVHGNVTGGVPELHASEGLHTNGRRVLAVHPDAGTAAKRWPVSSFIETIKALQATTDLSIVLIGLDRSLGEEIASQLPSPVDNQMGKTNLRELIDCLAVCDGLLTNDSGPAHVMAALGNPVWILWSGTADKKIWAPRGRQITFFENAVECAPCSLALCPVPGHPCLTKIRVEDVVGSIKSYFKEAYAR
jgi:ADP-heptose:LPS heptosyltransferase